jgi:hypothetical protein
MNMSARTHQIAAGNGSGRPAASDEDAIRLPLYLNPLRLAVSSSLWRSAGYLIVYLLTSWVLFSAAFTAATTAAVFAITLAGIPLLTAAAAVLRGCANVERARLRHVLTGPVRGSYREVTQTGLIAQAKTRWKDPATWRDVAYLIGMWVPLTILDTIVIAVWGWFLAMITLPAWYWAPWTDYHGHRYHGYQLGFWFPNGPHGPGTVGVFIGSLPAALLAAAAGLAGFLILNYAVVATVRAQAWTALSLLRPPADPLAAARDVLDSPGPLGPLTATIQNGTTSAHRQP